MNILKYVFVIAIASLTLGCSKDQVRYTNPNLPDYNFSIDIDTNLPLYTELKYVGNAKYIGQSGVGINGIFVINTGAGYAAYEASCPNQPLSTCSKMTKDGVVAVCPCDDVEYNLFSGEAQGQEYPLKPYRVQIISQDLIRVSN